MIGKTLETKKWYILTTKILQGKAKHAMMYTHFSDVHIYCTITLLF